MKNQTRKNTRSNRSNFLMKMEMIHINVPVHVKDIRKLRETPTNGRHYVPWLSLVPVEI